MAHAIDENQYNRIHGIVGWDCHGILAGSLRDSDCSRILLFHYFAANKLARAVGLLQVLTVF